MKKNKIKVEPAPIFEQMDYKSYLQASTQLLVVIRALKAKILQAMSHAHAPMNKPKAAQSHETMSRAKFKKLKPF